MSKLVEREGIILDTLRYKTKLSTLEVVELLDVSESTARRLFTELEQQGKVIRNYGGIKLAQDSSVDYSFEQLAQENVEEKRNIAAFAVGLVEDYDTVYIDSGTTLYQFCVALAERIERGQLQGLTVLTNSMVNLQLLFPLCNVILIGGEYRPKRLDFAGYASSRFIKNFSFVKCFLGADAVSLTDGLMTTDTDTASLVELAIGRSDKSIVLADAGKLGKRSFISFSPLENIDMLITSKSVDREIIQKIEKMIPVVREV